MEEQDYIDIEAWLQGELPAENEADFKRKLTEDETFAAALNERRELNNHLKAQAGEVAFRANLNKIIQAKQPETKVRELKPSRKRTPWVLILSAAATVLLLVVAFQFFYQDGPDLDQFYVHSPIALVERGDNNNLAQEIEATFNSGDYAGAIQPLRDFLVAQDSNPQAELALGISLLETNQDAEAEAVFKQLVQGGSTVAPYGLWYLALLEVRKGNNRVALDYLDKIPPNDSFLTAKAKELRKSL